MLQRLCTARACTLTSVAAGALATILGACVVITRAGVWVGAAGAIEDAASAAGHISGVAARADAAVLGAGVEIPGAAIRVRAAGAHGDALPVALVEACKWQQGLGGSAS